MLRTEIRKPNINITWHIQYDKEHGGVDECYVCTEHSSEHSEKKKKNMEGFCLMFVKGARYSFVYQLSLKADSTNI